MQYYGGWCSVQCTHMLPFRFWEVVLLIKLRAIPSARSVEYTRSWNANSRKNCPPTLIVHIICFFTLAYGGNGHICNYTNVLCRGKKDTFGAHLFPEWSQEEKMTKDPRFL